MSLVFSEARVPAYESAFQLNFATLLDLPEIAPATSVPQTEDIYSFYACLTKTCWVSLARILPGPG